MSQQEWGHVYSQPGTVFLKRVRKDDFEYTPHNAETTVEGEEHANCPS